MKVLIAQTPWIGGLFDYLAEALEKNGHQVFRQVYQRKKSALRLIKIHNIPQIRDYLERSSWDSFNRQVIRCFLENQANVFFALNQSCLLPETVRAMQKAGCKTCCYIADNPFDSGRFTFLPMTLKYYDFIFAADRIWIPSIQNVAPHSKVFKAFVGFGKERFFPIDDNEISDEEKKRFTCDISFTGESYGLRAEGAYRAGILDQLGKYNLKLWGDAGWKQRFPYYDNLQRFYQGGRLPFAELRKLYRISTINLNMPAPQVLTAFQPRVQEIAACKGFQIVDWREELDELFSEEELVTFKGIPDLIEKVEYFVRHPEKRQTYVEKMYDKVWHHHSWEERVREMMENIFPDLR